MTMVVLLALTAVMLAAVPAAAQKDPFEPVIDPDAATTTTTTGTITTTTTTTNPTEPVFQSDRFANTGTDVSPWLAIAYGLLVLGGAAVLLARMYQPQPLRRR
jgi:hypothetical protein